MNAEEPPADLAWLGEGDREPETIALIWATVDLDRALRERGSEPVDASSVTVDELLGARVVVVEAPEGQPRTAVAEPSTEGRLAATLARHGEGLAGRYVLAPAGLADGGLRAAAVGLSISRPADGPFGSSALVLGAVTGPHTVLVDRPAVPSRP